MINKFFYRKGGSEAYMFDLIGLLKNEGQQIIEFSMQDEKNRPSKFADYFVKNINFSKREGWLKDLKKAWHLLYSCEAKKKLETLVKTEKPDIAHLHNFNFQITPAILSVLKKYKIPVVWTMHDYHLICPNYRLFTQGKICERCKINKFYNCYKYKCIKNSRAMSFLAMLEMYLHKVILRSYDKIDLFISPSKFLAAKVQEWGIRPEKIKQLYNFVNLEEFKMADEIGEGLIYFGRLSEEKGLLFLLEAMKDLKDINLKLVGDGPQKTELKNFIAANNLSNVQLLGHKNGQELYNLIKNSRLVVLPSIWYENNPLAILEAFALAKPVIGSNLGGIPELVKEKETGFVFKAGDFEDLKAKIKDNYFQIDLIRNMGINARQFIEANCGPNKHYQQLLQIYQSLITQGF